MLLDEKRWDEWLGLYTSDCEYWVPTWLNQETLSSDPRQELAHIYYANRSGLEDRVLRIRSRRSPASLTTRRTTHIVGSVLVDAIDDAQARLRASWICHVFLPQYKKTDVQNDYMPSVVDIYCI
jgi:3-phenylpropionate/cinnamic acid dioxygenase small subunit